MIRTFKRKLCGPFSGEDRGVSPVIGVVLMVAITVILAAVIGAFVLGLGDGIGTEAQAGVTIEQTGDDEFRVTWTSQGNAADIYFDDVGDGTDPALEAVGESETTDSGTVVIAVTEDGQETVIATVD